MDDVTSSSDLARNRFSRNDDPTDSLGQPYLRSKAMGFEQLHPGHSPLGTVWPPAGSLPRRPQSFSSSTSSAFNEFSRHPVNSGLPLLPPQPLWLNESYPPARGITADRGFALAAAATAGLSVDPQTVPLLPFWSLHPGSVPPLLEPTGGASLKLTLSVPFEDHFERLKRILHSSFSERFGQDSQHGDGSPVESTETSDRRTADGGSATDTDEVDNCSSPLNLKRERPVEDQLIKRGHSEESGNDTDSDATPEKNASEASPGMTPGPFPTTITPPALTSSLSSPTSYTSLILSHISALQSQSPYPPAQTGTPHPHLYPYSPASYAMTSATALQIPNPGALPVSGPAGLQPVMPGAGAGQPRMDGAHGLSYYLYIHNDHERQRGSKAVGS